MRSAFSESSLHWTSKGVNKQFFTKQSLKHAVSFLIRTTSNLVFNQDICIPMGIDHAPFWANLFLYFFKSKYVKNLVFLEHVSIMKQEDLFMNYVSFNSLNAEGTII